MLSAIDFKLFLIQFSESADSFSISFAEVALVARKFSLLKFSFLNFGSGRQNLELLELLRALSLDFRVESFDLKV